MAAGNNLTHVTDDNFDREVLESKIPVIVDFWAEWCGPCRMIGPIFEELSKEYKGRLKFAKMNVDESREKPMVYGITGIPTMIVFKNGEIADRIVGAMPKGLLKAKIDEILSNID